MFPRAAIVGLAAVLLSAGAADAQQRAIPQPRVIDLQRERALEQQRLIRQQLLEVAAEEEAALVPNTGRSLDDLITALDAPALDVRQTAHAELSQRPDFSLAQLEEALSRPGLTPEQHLRLGAAARDKFADSPRGAMGISWNQEVLNRASIIGTIPGFDAFGKLEPGDIFVSAGGQPIRGTTAQRQLRWQIISRDPGEILTVVVRRGKELRTFDLTLGNFEQLNEGRAVLSGLDLASAYRLREQRLGRIATGDSLGLAADDWVVARVEGDERMRNQNIRRRSPNGQPVLVAGGAPRQGLDDDREESRLIGARGKIAVVRANPARIVLNDPMSRPVTTRQMTIQEEIAAVEDRITKLRKMVENPIDESVRPGVGVIEGQNADQIRLSAEKRLTAAERVLEALKAEAAETGELVEHTDSK